MKSRKCILVMALVVLVNPMGKAATISPSSGLSRSQQVSPKTSVPYSAGSEANRTQNGSRRGHSDGRYGDGLDRDERRGRGWYNSFRNTFWSPDFIWPRAKAINTFFSDLVSRFENYGISGDNYEKLQAEIRQLQDMLSQIDPDASLSQAIRHRLVEVIGKLVELAPGIDVQSLFQTVHSN